MDYAEVLASLDKAAKVIKEGGHVEDALGFLKEAAYAIGAKLLSKRGKRAEEGISLTEIGYRLEEAGSVDSETAGLFSEVSKMREMSHYDIWAIYSKEDLFEHIQKLRGLAEQAFR